MDAMCIESDRAADREKRHLQNNAAVKQWRCKHNSRKGF